MARVSLAQIGCTVEGRKWEGITYDPKSRTMYTALSAIERGMEVSMSSYRARHLHARP